jgi:AcrR family transcriptional regulator
MGFLASTGQQPASHSSGRVADHSDRLHCRSRRDLTRGHRVQNVSGLHLCMLVVVTGDIPPVGLRERKKLQTRAALLASATSLFEARGYEHVTVAEIADAANISVKTFFTYFRSKEDLAFADDHRLLEQIIGAVRSRPHGTSPADAVGALLVELLSQEKESLKGLEGYHRMVGDSLALRSRLLRMWEEYEDELTAVLLSELDGLSDGAPRARLAACSLVAMVRSFTSPEVLSMAAARRSPAARRKAVRGWAGEAAALVRDGIGNLA